MGKHSAPDSDSVDGFKGTRRDKPHNPSGWESKRDDDASAPLTDPPPNSESGWSATGRNK